MWRMAREVTTGHAFNAMEPRVGNYICPDLMVRFAASDVADGAKR